MHTEKTTTQLGLMPLFSTDFCTASAPIENLSTYIKILRASQVIPRRLIAPMFVLFDITSECNLLCDYCYNNSGWEINSRMDRSLILGIAEELVRLKVFSVCVSGGEPTQHHGFVDSIRFFHKHGIAVSSITNGYDLDEDIIREMSRNLAILQVTFDGPDAETHDCLRGRGSFQRAIRAVESLKRNNLRQLRVAFTCTSKNVHTFPRMMEFCRSIGADDLRSMQLVPVGRAFENTRLCPDPADVVMVKQQIAEWSRDPDLMSSVTVEWGEPHEHIRIGLAYGYLLAVNISSEGYFKISPYLPIAFGNAHRVSLAKAWKFGLGQGWNLPNAKPIFESIHSVADYAQAYKHVVEHPEARNGYLDLFPEVLYGFV